VEQERGRTPGWVGGCGDGASGGSAQRASGAHGRNSRSTASGTATGETAHQADQASSRRRLSPVCKSLGAALRFLLAPKRPPDTMAVALDAALTMSEPKGQGCCSSTRATSWPSKADTRDACRVPLELCGSWGRLPGSCEAAEVAPRPRGGMGRRDPHGAGGVLRHRRVHAHLERPAFARPVQRGGGRNGGCVGRRVARRPHLKSYVSKDEALSDLDVPENAVEPISPLTHARELARHCFPRAAIKRIGDARLLRTRTGSAGLTPARRRSRNRRRGCSVPTKRGGRTRCSSSSADYRRPVRARPPEGVAQPMPYWSRT
jgi:hypothetical protein